MEIKITADNKLLEALNGLAEALRAALTPASAPAATSAAKVKPAPAPKEKPVTAQPEPPETAPLIDFAALRSEAQQTAVVKIQAGRREEVKALVKSCGGSRVGDIPEDNLSAFVAGLEAIK